MQFKTFFSQHRSKSNKKTQTTFFLQDGIIGQVTFGSVVLFRDTPSRINKTYRINTFLYALF